MQADAMLAKRMDKANFQQVVEAEQLVVKKCNFRSPEAGVIDPCRAIAGDSTCTWTPIPRILGQ
ncbi:hypothetical protein A235_15573 [Pseudomonas syringae pv. actinidiae ICMP 19079]|nr:hypothetical protein A235_15573 [Pseudomonas syringae pv. actinidiae ICMP 19079]